MRAAKRSTFGQAIGGGWPSVSSLTVSTALHALVVLGLGMISFQPRPVPKPPPVAEHPTVIRIGDRLYFVTHITAAPRPSEKTAARRELPQPTSPARPVKRPVKGIAQLEAAAPDPAAPPAPAPAPKAFIPPNTPKNLISDATLIQPLFPPDLPAVVPQLPSFRVWTAPLQAPKIPKPFVAPGRRNPAPPEQTQAPPPPPTLELIHADPVPSNLKSALVLPPTPPIVLDSRPPQTNLAQTPPSPVGDPVNILSLNDRPVPATDKLVVPPGNLAGRLGDETGFGPGGTTNAPGNSAAARPAESTGGSSSGSGMPNAKSEGADRGATRGSPEGAAGNGAAAAGPHPGDVAILGAGGRSSPARNAPGYGVITRQPNGNFDAVVIQSSSLDQFPESKGLLSGRPIYTVYISVGTAKEWALYFCVPGEKTASAAQKNVVELGPATPVQAPYPTRLMRPQVTVPAYYKYVLIHGYVNATGRFERLHVVKPIQPETDDAIVASLSGWEFRAATRDGVKVAVEFLLSIPVSGL